jgi:hypothetical protein
VTATNESGVIGLRLWSDEIVDAGLAGRGLQRLEGPVLTVFLRDLRFVLHRIGGSVNRNAVRFVQA